MRSTKQNMTKSYIKINMQTHAETTLCSTMAAMNPITLQVESLVFPPMGFAVQHLATYSSIKVCWQTADIKLGDDGWRDPRRRGDDLVVGMSLCLRSAAFWPQPLILVPQHGAWDSLLRRFQMPSNAADIYKPWKICNGHNPSKHGCFIGGCFE